VQDEHPIIEQKNLYFTGPDVSATEKLLKFKIFD
jgi:hypothetical protein